MRWSHFPGNPSTARQLPVGPLLQTRTSHVCTAPVLSTLPLPTPSHKFLFCIFSVRFPAGHYLWACCLAFNLWSSFGALWESQHVGELFPSHLPTFMQWFVPPINRIEPMHRGCDAIFRIKLWSVYFNLPLINPGNCTVFSSNPNLAAKKSPLSWPTLGLLCAFLSQSQGIYLKQIYRGDQRWAWFSISLHLPFILMAPQFQLFCRLNEDSRQKLWARLSSNLHLILDDVPLLLFSLI